MNDAGSVLSIAPQVPAGFRELIVTLGSIIAPRDQRLDEGAVRPPVSARSFSQNEDGAPLLFGTDVRLRNLLALAKHGPLYATELRGLTGVTTHRSEGRDFAPFGRSGLVRTWRDRHGLAVDLDCAFPLVLPLRCLLLRLEQTYRLPPFLRMYAMPTPPKLRPWKGDRLALFGGPIATNILVSIGVLGWTFEALCVAVAVGYDRVVVKKALLHLEKQRVLEGDRQRKPGFNVRLMTVSCEFPARDELNTLLRAYASVWPDLADRVRWTIAHVSPRTREHLRRRNIVPSAPSRSKSKPSRRRPDGRLECLRRYYALTNEAGRALASHEILSSDNNLYRGILRNWGTFGAFRQDAGLKPVLKGEARRPSPGERENCIAKFFELSRRVGFLPNTTDLNCLDVWLSARIRKQWGGFPAVCEDLNVYPARRKRSSRVDDATNRQNCRSEYRSLMQILGVRPNSGHLRRHTDGLYKRIRRSWPSFEAFCDDIGVTPPRRYAVGSRAGPRPRR